MRAALESSEVDDDVVVVVVGVVGVVSLVLELSDEVLSSGKSMKFKVAGQSAGFVW